MRRIVSLMLAIMLSTIFISVSAAGKDEEGHRLVSLWKEYNAAVEKDKPRDQVSILEKIKKEAAAKRLNWDYYCASKLYVTARTNINWKLRSDLEKQKEKELDAYNDTFVNLFRKFSASPHPDSLFNYIGQHEAVLRRSFNPEFYAHDESINRASYSNALIPLITNDYDFALWHIFLLNSNEQSNERAEKAILERYSNEYPFAGFVEFSKAIRTSNKEEERKSLSSFVAAYSTKAVSLLGRQRLIEMDFNDRYRDKNSTGKDFEKIQAACNKFIADRETFTDSEKAIADCCKGPDGILEQLTEKSIGFSIKNGKVELFLRNLPSVRFRILDENDNLVHEKTIPNPAGSFYACDTLHYEIPDIADGEYQIECLNGDTKDYGSYEKYTLSLACKQDAYGHAVYVADYLSGEPLDKVDLTLSNSKGEVVTVIKDFRIDGFTYLPESIENRLKSGVRGDDIFASTSTSGGTYRKSNSSTFFYSPERENSKSDFTKAILLTDRGAYNPGETIHYKVILYKGQYEFSIVENAHLDVVLTDAGGDEIGSADLTTGEFGSAAGEFILTRGARNERYRLSVKDDDGRTLATKAVTVDDFVLPTFVLNWNKQDKFYLPGEEISVSGQIASYSGHPLSTAKAEYTVRDYKDTVDKGRVELTADGNFNIRFKAGDSENSQYYILLKVTDATGETLEFTTSVYSRAYPPLVISLENQTKSNHYPTLSEDLAKVSFRMRGIDDTVLYHDNLKISYEVLHRGRTVFSGAAANGETKQFDLSGMPAGKYLVKAIATAKGKDSKEYTQKKEFEIYKVKDSDTLLSDGITNFFKYTADEIGLQFGNCGAPVWAIAELYGTGNVLLQKRMVTLDAKNNLKTVAFDYKEEYPDAVTLKIFYFLDGESHDYQRVVNRKVNRLELPFSFTRFLDTTRPGAAYTFEIKTEAGVECAATVFDKSTENIRDNEWYPIQARNLPAPNVFYQAICGRNSARGFTHEPIVLGYRTKAASAIRSVNGTSSNEMIEADAAVQEEEAIPFSIANNDRPAGYVRENFANTIAWEPFLRSDQHGKISFKFKNADKLSTYFVQLFAHKTNMHNAVLRKEMMVTIPVKIAVVEPQILYSGDELVLSVSLANSFDVAVNGILSVSFLNGSNHESSSVISKSEKTLSIPAHGNTDVEFPIHIPDIENLGIKIIFNAEKEYGSDGVFVSVPVRKAVQKITEAHSSLLLDGQDRNKLIEELRSQFVNTDGSNAVVKEISIADMIHEALPSLVNFEVRNSISLTEALYANKLISSINPESATDCTEALKRIGSCQNIDGGFGWFEGMDSSPILTLVILERFAAMEELQSAIDVTAAVKYLDQEYLGNSKRPLWCGRFNQAQYLYLRSLYPDISLNTTQLKGKALREFKKRNREYLTPVTERNLNGQILAKARRLKTLLNLTKDPAGKRLAASLGISSNNKLNKSIQADIASLTQYAEAHRSGGHYFPNAVLPWRGLLESELYAHSLLCDLFEECGYRNLADNIRLWIMVQKETQKWEKDPDYIEAIASVLRGSDKVLNTKVVTLTKTVAIPFARIRNTGNGFSIDCKYYRDDELITGNTVLKVGDKIVAHYIIWNGENRSFVRLSAPRSAALRPVQQLSGRIGWKMQPLSVPGSYVVNPQGYRNVLKDRTEYWFDSFPEEYSTIEEEFFVTQAGTFQTPAIEIESLYAPHYRANSSAPQIYETR